VESSGAKNRIHVSQDTADRILAAGKGSWLIPRAEKVNAKGIGEIQTYWVYTKGDTSKASDSQRSIGGSIEEGATNPLRSKLFERNESGRLNGRRVLDWTVEIFLRVLKEVVAHRESIRVKPDTREVIKAAEEEIIRSYRYAMPLDEVKEVINMPKYHATKAADVDPDKVTIGQDAISQLKDFIVCISDTYNQNPFHNFEHASHVTLSVVKLLKRIVAPTEKDDNERDHHDHTYGITSDPLTQFAVVLSALIHDVDHSGVPNTQLINEGSRLAAIYKGKSVAEQNSVAMAWNLLMEDKYEALRMTIYSTKAELRRFRQMLVHTVLATDIMDKELSEQRKNRWALTFANQHTDGASMLIPQKDETDRKATIVIEHLMQASDVAHTMQHWHIYIKWNARLFKEMYTAYKEGRAAKDPSENWYKGEIGFFDFYVIPLAQKLKSCGVFGVSSDEYLNYARHNRAEWEEKGQELIDKLVMEMETEGAPTRLA
jgi:hypothetical protein